MYRMSEDLSLHLYVCVCVYFIECLSYYVLCVTTFAGLLFTVCIYNVYM